MSLYNKIITFWFHFSWNFWWPLALDENSCFIAQKITIVNLIMKVVQRIIFIPYVESKFKKNYYFWEPEYVRNYTVFFFFFFSWKVMLEKERQMVQWPRVGQVKKSASSWSPSCWQGTGHLGCLPLLSLLYEQGAASEVKQLELQPAATGNVGLAGRGLKRLLHNTSPHYIDLFCRDAKIWSHSEVLSSLA